ncbi:CueP family metal-binding protein [Tessaracoccus sp. OS52]|uniref:CueP family metal-binding protein n=1 Tax=Tessaracoccus sp. OS52 TaxID=2886691 RepID=UPI001D0FC1FD|nr:CueP family metal-binding protein [Tessaracoccus sp. OS52]MCC2592502.1 CueP family metal-binding protein [Tessaracoccus sp. OS52]
MSLQHARPRWRSHAIIASLLATLILASCATATTDVAVEPPSGTDSYLADHGLAGLDARQIIEMLDTMPVSQRPSLIASVRPDELVLTDDQAGASLPMPDDEFYLSLAPFRSQTHDCYFHSLTTCQGELANIDVQVTVTDNDTGETLIDESRRTYDNGFLGLWLPRGVDATLTVETGGQSASTTISTANPEDPTCLTTLQLT